MMFMIWVGASLAIGRGWCSWGCFYGGWDEFFSRLRQKPVIQHKQIDRRWIYLPFAILLAIVLLSAVTLSPVYCDVAVSVQDHHRVRRAHLARWPSSQMVIFVTLFLGLVVVLPAADQAAHPVRAVLSLWGDAVLLQQDQHL